jgi:hypothetical protein
MTTADMRYPATVRGVTDALDALGRTGVEVAAALLAGGHTGYVGSVYRCPVARYLTAVLDDAEEIEASPETIVVWSTAERGHHTVSVPPPVAGFMAGFDARRHPDLISADHDMRCTCTECRW